MGRMVKKMHNGTAALPLPAEVPYPTGGKEAWCRITEAQVLFGQKTLSGTRRWLERSGITKIAKVKSRKGNVYFYSRKAVEGLYKQEATFRVKKMMQEPKAESVSETEMSEKQKEHIGGEWMTVPEIGLLFGFRSDSGVLAYLRRVGCLPKKTALSSRGRKLFLFDRKEIEKLHETEPKRKRKASIPRGVKQQEVKEERQQIEKMNEVIEPDLYLGGKESIVEALQALFRAHPQLVEVFANRITGRVNVVMAHEGRLRD